MGLVLAHVGALKVLTAFFASQALTLKLFTNDYTPLPTSVAGDFIEATGGEYASKSLASASWTVAMNNGIPQASYPDQTWGFTTGLSGGQQFYGYFIVDGAGTLIHAERASLAFTPMTSGTAYVVSPKFQLSYGTPTA